MAKPNYQYEKRQKDLTKKKKQDEKQEEKRQRREKSSVPSAEAPNEDSQPEV